MDHSISAITDSHSRRQTCH